MPLESCGRLPLFISEVEILPIKPQGGLVAFASCILNGQIYLGNIGIHTRPDGSGYRLVFPVKVLPNGKQIHCFHPITREAADLIYQTVISRLEALTKKCGEKVATTSKQSGGSNDYNAGVS